MKELLISVFAFAAVIWIPFAIARFRREDPAERAVRITFDKVYQRSLN